MACFKGPAVYITFSFIFLVSFNLVINFHSYNFNLKKETYLISTLFKKKIIKYKKINNGKSYQEKKTLMQNSFTYVEEMTTSISARIKTFEKRKQNSCGSVDFIQWRRN